MSSTINIQNDLKKIGLNEQEILTYLTCLRHPKTTPSKLAIITNIKRTTLYPILQKLLDINLIYKKVLLKKKYLYAHPPKQGMQSVSKNAYMQAEDIAKITERLVEKLESNIGQYSPKSDSGAIFLSGKPGVRDLVQRVLDEKQNIYWIGPSKLFLDLDKNQQRELFQRLSVKRMDNGTTAFAMTDKKFESSTYFHGGKESYRQLRTLTLPDSMNAMIVVTGNLCGFVKSFGNKLEAVIFTDTEYAEIIKFVLQILWSSLKK